MIYLRPLSLTFLTLFAYWIYKNYCSEVHLKTTIEFEREFEVLKENIIILRQKKPTMFILIASASLTALSLLGYLFPGPLIILQLVCCIVITYLKFVIRQILEYTEDPLHTYNDIDYDVFLPEETEFNMNVLEEANDLSSRIEEGEDDESISDEVPTDDIPEVNEISTEDDQEEYLPTVKIPKTEKFTKISKDPIDRDSSLSSISSSSEESLSKGLKFPDHTTVDGPRASVRYYKDGSSQQIVSQLGGIIGSSQALLGHSSKLIPSLMTGLVQGVLGVNSVNSAFPMQDTSNICPVTSPDLSDDSDFEIIDYYENSE